MSTPRDLITLDAFHGSLLRDSRAIVLDTISNSAYYARVQSVKNTLLQDADAFGAPIETWNTTIFMASLLKYDKATPRNKPLKQKTVKAYIDKMK